MVICVVLLKLVQGGRRASVTMVALVIGLLALVSAVHANAHSTYPDIERQHPPVAADCRTVHGPPFAGGSVLPTSRC